MPATNTPHVPWWLARRGFPRACAAALAVLLVAGAAPARAEPTNRVDPGQHRHGGWRCGTPAEVPRLASKTRAVVPAFANAEGLVERDSFGSMESTTSDHFALKWGEPGAVNPAHIGPVLAALELAWTEYIEELEHRYPTGAEVYYVNAYIGNTGGAAPEIDFDGGYATIDDDGYPYLVLSPGMLGDPVIAEVAVHEFYHVVQMSTEGFWYADEALWYWEATAEWASQEVYPNGDYVYYALGSYGTVPEVSLDFFSDPFAETLVAMHQYGAYIFPRFITEQVTNRRIIRDTWELAEPGDIPLELLDALLAEADTTIDDVFADFAAHNATWDYERGELFGMIVNAYADYYPEEAHPIAATVGPRGTGDWVNAPQATLPWAYGYNVIELADPQRGDFLFAVEGDAEGSRGTASHFRATVVRELPDDVLYQPIPLEGTAGEVVVEAVDDEVALYLVVTAQPQNKRDSEVFGFKYRVQFDANLPFPATDRPALPTPLTDEYRDDDDGGGGCSTSGPRAPLVLVLVLACALPLMWRRRRA